MEIKQLKAKPIYKEEKELIESRLNIILPDDCWIVGGGTKYVYLDIYSSEYYLKFKVENGGNWILLKDNSQKFDDYERVTLQQTLDNERDRIEKMWERLVQRTFDFVNEHRDTHYTISISGGKDSEVLYNLWYTVVNKLDYTPDYEFIFFNTSNEVAEVYRYIKERKDIRIVNPEMGLFEFIKTKQNYLLPTLRKRYCCSKYKEGQVKKTYDNKKPNIQVMGVRKTESNTRANYDFYMDYDFDKNVMKGTNSPKTWSKLAPIVELTTIDVWLLMLIKNFFVNRKYRLGWNRVGCTICPFSSAYDDELVKMYYPKAWERWCNLVTKTYETYNIAKIEGWTCQEYINGVWKNPQSKDSKWLNRKPTPENIHNFAEYKGISDELAAKYWVRECSKCGGFIMPMANAMFFKFYGRYEGQIDTRERLCQKCLAKELNMTLTEFYAKALEFKEQGCCLF